MKLEIRGGAENLSPAGDRFLGLRRSFEKVRPQDHRLGVDSLAALAFYGAALRPPARGRLAGGAGV